MIFCFSGTGNSLWVARQLAKELNDEIITIGKEPLNCRYVGAVNERIIWVFPIYSWGLPPVVKHFMTNSWLEFDGLLFQHYMVCTCGDDIGLAHKQWRKIIQKRRWNARSTFSVQMPNTYTLMKGFDVDSHEIVTRKLTNALTRVGEIAQQIKHGAILPATDDVTTGSWAWVKTRIIYPYFMRFCMSPKPFHATHDCIGCSRCARECLMQNITMINDRPHWGNNCTMCLRCYHTCSQHAIAYGKATRYKGQYLCPKK